MKIYVISLADAVQRRAQVKSQLEALGCPFQFFEAIDGPAGTRIFQSINSRQYLLNTGRTPSPGEVGCYASHMGLWKLCADSREPICVLEDDCDLEPFFPAALQTASMLTEEFGFIRLQRESWANKEFVREVNEFQLFRYTKMTHSTLAYVIAPTVAQSFIEQSKTMAGPVDVFIKLFWEHGNPLYGLMPYAASEGAMSRKTHIHARTGQPQDLGTRIARLTTKAGWLIRRAAWNRAFAKTE